MEENGCATAMFGGWFGSGQRLGRPFDQSRALDNGFARSPGNQECVRFHSVWFIIPDHRNSFRISVRLT